MINWLDYFKYENGKLIWLDDDKFGRNKTKGKEAGLKIGSHGYKQFQCHRAGLTKPVLVHRVVWEMHNGEIPYGMHIDHINRDKTDNRIENLRCVSVSMNVINSKLSKNNTSGVTGVNFYRNGWQASIMVNRKNKHLGRFKTLNDAVEARKQAEINLFGEYLSA